MANSYTACVVLFTPPFDKIVGLWIRQNFRFPKGGGEARICALHMLLDKSPTNPHYNKNVIETDSTMFVFPTSVKILY